MDENANMEEMKRKRTRTVADLVAELDSEQSKFFFVALVVAFEEKVTLILDYREINMQKLRNALNAGGMPVGLAGVVIESATMAGFYTRAFAELANDARVVRLLEEQMQAVTHAAKLPPTVTDMKQRSGWINVRGGDGRETARLVERSQKQVNTGLVRDMSGPVQ